MNKSNRTSKLQSRADFTMRPSRVRMAAIYTFFFALAVLAGMLIRLIFNRQGLSLAELFSDWAMYLAIVVGGAVLFALMDYTRWTITVRGGEKIEGSSGAMGNRSLLELGLIDWKRTRRSLDSRLKIGNAIYTTERQRILISPWFYPPDVYSEFLDRIGYNQEQKL